MRRSFCVLVSLACVFLLGSAGPVVQRPLAACNVWCLSQRAREALDNHRYADYVTYARQAVERAPDLPAAVYTLARAYAFTGQTAASLQQLRRAADIGATQDPESDSAFAGLRQVPSFQSVLTRLTQNRSPVVRGTLAFALPDPDLLPEALAPDQRTGGWLIGSLAGRKLIRLTPDGAASDFIVGQGLLRVVGIHADTARSLLWFATWAPRLDGQPPGQVVASDTRLFKCDLTTGRILRAYAPSDSGGSHLFNDLALAANGEVFITDTRQGWIYRVQPSGDSLEVFLRPDPARFTAANGIALSPDQRTLYIGYVEGIARIDVPTRTAARLPSPRRGSTASVDGLYYYRGSLIAVQHRPGLEQVARFRLSPDGRAIVESQVLERGGALMNLPTTGAVVGDRFYYIATSQYDRLGQGNDLAATDVLSGRSTVRVINLARH